MKDWRQIIRRNIPKGAEAFPEAASESPPYHEIFGPALLIWFL
jgi:hypothetical protein